MTERTVTCPQCGQPVQVPVTGEKVRCPGCGQKFRFDLPPIPVLAPIGVPGLPPPLSPGESPAPVQEAKPPEPPPLGPAVPSAAAPPLPANEFLLRKVPDREGEAPAEPLSRIGEAQQAPSPAEAGFGAREARELRPPVVSPAPLSATETNEVRCPRCGSMVQVPLTGEKVRCPGCGQKFRWEVPAGSAAGALPALASDDEPATEPPPLGPAAPSAAALPLPANEVRCPRCGSMVQVPLTGEKVRCPGCGQKFRWEVPAGSPAGALSALDSDDEPTTDEAPPTPAPAPIADMMPGPSPTPPASAEELFFLWPSLCQFIARLYERGRAEDDDRVRFRTHADRAAALARALLPAESSAPYEFLTLILPQTTLDEVLRLNLEDFRHLQESLDEAQLFLARRLVPAAPVLPQIAARPLAAERPAAGERAAPARRSSLAAWIGVGAMAVAAIAVVLAWPQLQGLLERRSESPRPLATNPVVIYPSGTPTTAAERPRTKAPGLKAASKVASVAVPKFEKPTTSAPSTLPPTEPKETPSEPAKPEPAKRILSPWKATPEGWIDLFNGKDLDGLTGDPETWSVKDGILQGVAPNGIGLLGVQQANWTHYTLTLDVKLGKQGSVAIGHGPLAAFLAEAKSRLGYAGDAARVLDESSKGLARNQWQQVEFEVKGPRAEVRVGGKPILTTAGHTPQAGAPSIEVHSGAVALRSFRLRLNESDPDYRAVILREGYLVEKEEPTEPPAGPEKPAAGLGPGDHVLFNHADLEGWTKVGDWRLGDRAVVGHAVVGDRSLLVAGSADWQDYTFRARARHTRVGRGVREGEYILLGVRYQSPNSFYCVRFAIEGVFEVGYYRGGQFHNIQQARAGLGNWFDRWHDIQLEVHGDQLTLSIDNHAYPPYTMTGLERGAVALGVTGGEVAFSDARVKVLR